MAQISLLDTPCIRKACDDLERLGITDFQLDYASSEDGVEIVAVDTIEKPAPEIPESIRSPLIHALTEAIPQSTCADSYGSVTIHVAERFAVIAHYTVICNELIINL